MLFWPLPLWTWGRHLSSTILSCKHRSIEASLRQQTFQCVNSEIFCWCEPIFCINEVATQTLLEVTNFFFSGMGFTVHVKHDFCSVLQPVNCHRSNDRIHTKPRELIHLLVQPLAVVCNCFLGWIVSTHHPVGEFFCCMRCIAVPTRTRCIGLRVFRASVRSWSWSLHPRLLIRCRTFSTRRARLRCLWCWFNNWDERSNGRARWTFVRSAARWSSR